MNYTPFESTGLQISPLVLGAGNFGADSADHGRTRHQTRGKAVRPARGLRGWADRR